MPYQREEPAPQDRPSHTNHPHSDSTTKDTGLSPATVDAAPVIAPWDAPTYDHLGGLVADLLTAAGHNRAQSAAILGHALLAIAGSKAGAEAEARIAAFRRMGHGVGVQLLTSTPVDRHEGLADMCNDRARRTTSIPKMVSERATEAVLRGWIGGDR